MDYEDVGNLTGNGDISPRSTAEFIAHEVIFTVVCLFAIVADAFIIYIFYRFRRMKTVPNLLLTHWAMADFASLIFTPSGYRVIFLIEHISLSREFLCVILQIGSTLHFMTIWFAILIAMDWCIATYFEKASKKLRRYYKYLLGSLWTFGFLYASSTGGMCFSNNHVDVHGAVLLLSYFAILLLIIGFQISRAVQMCRRKFVEYPTLMLNLVTAIVTSWGLAFLNIIITQWTGIYHQVLEIFAECNMFCSSIIIFILFYKLNKDFQGCFINVIKRSRDNYEEADFDFENPVFNSRNKNPIVKLSSKNDCDELVDQELTKCFTNRK